jgi:hypothetical protein
MPRAVPIDALLINITVVSSCFLSRPAHYVLNALIVAAARAYSTVRVAITCLDAVVWIHALVKLAGAAPGAAFIPKITRIIDLLKSYGANDAFHAIAFGAAELLLSTVLVPVALRS